MRKRMQSWAEEAVADDLPGPAVRRPTLGRDPTSMLRAPEPHEGRVFCALNIRYGLSYVDGTPTTVPMVAVALHAEGQPDAKTLDEAARWPAHRAAFHDDARALERATAGWGEAEWGALDACGNSVLHVAVLRRAEACVRFILATGCRAAIETKNSVGWTPLEEAVELRDEAIARPIFDWVDANLVSRPPGKAELRSRALAALSSMPDFTLTLKWRFGSPLFGYVVKRYAPSDTYTLWKRGDKLRIDGSLTGVDVEGSLLPRWKRGRFSLLIAPEHAGGTPRVWLAYHNSRTLARPGRILKKMSRADADDERPNLPDTLPVTLELSVRPDGTVGAVVCAREPPPPASAADLKFSAMMRRGVLDARTEVRPDAASFKPACDWRGNPSRETIAGVPTHVYEAATRVRTTHVNKVNKYAVAGSFEAYVANRHAAARANANQVSSELLQIPVSYDDLMKCVGYREREHPETEGSRLRAKVWLARDFPLNVSHMQLLLDVIAHANTSAARLSQARARPVDVPPPTNPCLSAAPDRMPARCDASPPPCAGARALV